MNTDKLEFNTAYDCFSKQAELEETMKSVHSENNVEYVRFCEICKFGILEDAEAYYQANNDILNTELHQNNILFWDCVYLKCIDVAIWIYSLQPFELKFQFDTTIHFYITSFQITFLKWLESTHQQLVYDSFLNMSFEGHIKYFTAICIHKSPHKSYNKLETVKWYHDVLIKVSKSIAVALFASINYIDLFIDISKDTRISFEFLDWILNLAIPYLSDTPLCTNTEIILKYAIFNSNIKLVKWLYNRELIFPKNLYIYIELYISKCIFRLYTLDMPDIDYIKNFKWLHDIIHVYCEIEKPNLFEQYKSYLIDSIKRSLIYTNCIEFTSCLMNIIDSYGIIDKIPVSMFHDAITENIADYDNLSPKFIKLIYEYTVRFNNPFDFTKNDHSIIKILNDNIEVDGCIPQELADLIISTHLGVYKFNGTYIIIINEFSRAIESGDFSNILASLEIVEMHDSTYDSTCIICTMEFTKNLPPLMLQCKHVYCVRCVVYLYEERKSNICSCCRQKYDFTSSKKIVKPT